MELLKSLRKLDLDTDLMGYKSNLKPLNHKMSHATLSQANIDSKYESITRSLQEKLTNLAMDKNDLPKRNKNHPTFEQELIVKEELPFPLKLWKG